MTQPNTNYDQGFYDNIRDSSFRSAGQLVPMILELFRPTSVIDIGCGDGTWLSVFRKHGVSDALGIDGDYVDRTTLKIPVETFQAHDLTKPVVTDRHFDLAISLEVGEHLPAASAADFVKTLTRLANRVIFSAAIPGQGGTSHVNEQWPSYWATLFQNERFAAIDSLRSRIWTNPDVAWWYAQNVIVYERVTADSQPADPVMPLPLVHPGLLDMQKHYDLLRPTTPLDAMRTLKGTIVASMKQWTGSSKR